MSTSDSDDEYSPVTAVDRLADYHSIEVRRTDISCISSLEDPWTFTDGATPSMMTLNGLRTTDVTKRKSTSIVDAFRCNEHLTDAVWTLLREDDPSTGIYIGLGSKHIYHTGDYLKTHTDRDRPPPAELSIPSIPYTHTHTLVVFPTHGYQGGKFAIDGLPVDEEQYEYRGILFTRGMPHSVEPVTGGTRVSFSFPIYIRDGTNAYIKDYLDKVSLSEED